ncbi:coagulation factor XI-like [Salmo trutta]|uniref:coagulation factor XI-like n=1 Tax=Salmo trutta TaxID=8032 RepID=UPI0011302852|nr:coagulation factor XI-like [Salmo trutta]
MWLPTAVVLFLGAAPDLFFSQQYLDESFRDIRAVEPSHCSEGFMVDKDFHWNDILMVYERDLHHCQLACTQNPGCSYFSYVVKKFRCYQKYSDGQPTMTNYPGVISGYSRKGCSKEGSLSKTTGRRLDEVD